MKYNRKTYGILLAILGAILFLYLATRRRSEGFQGAESRTVDLVVARYKENLDWLSEYKDTKFQNVFIYNKSDDPVEDCKNEYANCVIKKLPNVGVCDHTYLHHIIENYDNLADVTVFAPGSANLEYKKEMFKTTLDMAIITKDTFLNVFKFDIDADKAMYTFHMKNYVGASVENRDQADYTNVPANPTPYGPWFQANFPEVHTHYSTFIGIFAVAKEHIRNRPKSFYEDLIKQVNTNIFHEASHFIERAWLATFWPVPERCLYVSPIVVDIINRLNGGFKAYRLTEGFSSNDIAVSIYIVCYNEEILIRDTIKHYRSRLPNATITICDNYSTDNSVEIAKESGCNIIQWETTPQNFEFKLTELKNTVWKNSPGWVIMCDMDEWLCIDEAQLSEEDKIGTTCIQVLGYDIIGHSNTSTLNDIDLHTLSYGYPKVEENKNLCFNAKYITAINYDSGAHKSNPEGKATFSKRPYYLKHMDWLGLEYKQNKMKTRYERTKEMQKLGMATHYTDDMNKVATDFNTNASKATDISNLIT